MNLSIQTTPQLGWLVFVILLSSIGNSNGRVARGADRPLRVATFNVEDVRTEQLTQADHPRLRALAVQIQRIRPDIILLNEIAFDFDSTPPGQNGQRFADQYLHRTMDGDAVPVRYVSLMAPTNTGMSSGFDLDRDGRIAGQAPKRSPQSRVEPAEPAAVKALAEEGRRYGGDCWGYGTFPGQYGMALLVREGLEIDRGAVRTFQQFRWSQMPGALIPTDPRTNNRWYDAEAWEAFRLSSKSHWDVPVRLPDGSVFHVLCSHPTPPVFDGPEDRNGCRNHDEIRFWAEYLHDAPWIVDDRSQRGGLAKNAAFVILGDLNADPDEGDSRDNPIGKFLLEHPRIDATFVPKARTSEAGGAYAKLDADDTARWGLRVDYLLPSRGCRVTDGAIERPAPEAPRSSDHFLVWVDLLIPDPIVP